MNHETHEIHEKIIYKEECFQIQGAIFEVYKEMGSGFLENVYQECLEKEFSLKGIPFVTQKEILVEYKGQQLKQYYKADFFCYDKILIILELKAVKEIAQEHKAQLFNYLKATKLRLGLLVNFGHYPKVLIERFVL
jgi:GxxExxY protein